MNILVCASLVPDTSAKIGVADDGKKINPQGVKFILNPYDEFAIEEGLQLKEKHGGTVTTVTVGTPASKEVLQRALAMGADAAVLINDPHSSDSFVVASSIAEYAKELSPDIIIFGKQSIDFDSFAVPGMVAQLLELPSVSIVSTLTIDGTTVTAECDIEGGKEKVTCSLPCIVSAQKGLNDPRYPKLPDIMKAKSKPITERAVSSVQSRTETVSMTLPDLKRLNKIYSDSDADIAELVRLLHEEAKVI